MRGAGSVLPALVLVHLFELGVEHVALVTRTARLRSAAGRAGLGTRRILLRVGLLGDRSRASEMGNTGREHVVTHWSIDRMVQGYESLLTDIYAAKARSGNV